jgi:hypothetical protein
VRMAWGVAAIIEEDSGAERQSAREPELAGHIAKPSCKVVRHVALAAEHHRAPDLRRWLRKPRSAMTGWLSRRR